MSGSDRPRVVDEIEETQLSLVLRLALGGNLPSQRQLGETWFDRRELVRVAVTFADLEPLRALAAPPANLRVDEALRMIANGLLSWAPEDRAHLPAGVNLRAEELALLRLLATNVAYGDDKTLTDLDGKELRDHTGRFLIELRPDTAARWRSETCDALAHYLLTTRGPPLADGVAAEIGHLMYGGWALIAPGDPRLIEEYGLGSALTNDAAPPYVPRGSDVRLAARLVAAQRPGATRADRLVVVAGPPKSGKTRSLLEVLATEAEGWEPGRVVLFPIRSPRPGDVPLRELAQLARNLREVVDGDVTYVVLVDDLHAHLMTGLLPRQDLGALLAADHRLVVAATVHDVYLVQDLPANGYGQLDVKMLSSRSVRYESELTDDEQGIAYAALGNELASRLEKGEISRLAETFGAVRAINAHAEAARADTSLFPERHAMVEGSIDAAMVYSSFTVDQLRALWNLWFTTLAPGLQRDTDSRFDRALKWAETRFGQAQMLAWTGPEPVQGRLRDRNLALLLAGHRAHDNLRGCVTPEDLAAGGTAYAINQRALDAEHVLAAGAELGNTRAMSNLGLILYRQGREQEAEFWYRRAAAAGSLNAMCNLGLLLDRSDRREEAEVWYRRAVAEGHQQSMFNLGVLLAESTRHAEAEVWYRRAAESGHTDAMVNLGRLLAKSDRAQEAESWWRRAMVEGDLDAAFNLGTSQLASGWSDEAEQVLRAAADAGHVKSMVNLGGALVAANRTDEALGLYERAAEAGEGAAMLQLAFLHAEDTELCKTWLLRAAEAGNVQAMFTRGQALAGQGEMREAAGWFVRAGQEGHVGAGVALGEIFEALEQTDVARSLYQDAAETGHIDAMLKVGALLARAGESGAEEWFVRAADAGSIDALFNLGLLAQRSNRIDEAESWYRRAAESGLTDAMCNLAEILERDGSRRAEAAVWILRAAEAGHPGAYDQVGARLLQEGRFSEAESWLRTRSEAGDVHAISNLAVTLEKLGRDPEAESWYRRAAEAGVVAAMTNLSSLLERLGRSDEAEHWSLRASDGTDH